MIEFCFDFVSPYAYLAWTQVLALGKRVGHEVRPKPVLFAALLNAHGTKGPAEVPAKREYILKDVLRMASRAGLTVTVPPAHPFNPLIALRVAGLPILSDEERVRVVDALFTAPWGHGEAIDTADAVAAVLGRAGIDAAPLLVQAATAEGKDRLRRDTEEVLARGAFGVPTMFVGNEMFFGFDSFRELEAYARGEDVLAAHQDVLRQWLELPAAAVRK
ncbi:2-hydroxychromene-2-carboxylate isomerase [Pendulispora rubella]|uniref:2-hydroxychromene-2-carboxylate isomerase n=1 Tax=Pendulispora rubella TaxID=2741070 RepID=A0ABZ2L899_9BACT